MRIAIEVASRATCLRRHVGAVLVKGNRILSTGYNGSPSGGKHCTEVGCLVVKREDEDGSTKEHCIRTVHAEENAILHAAKHGVSTEDSTLYVTAGPPCVACAKNLINAGIKKIIFAGNYPGEHAVRFLKEANIELVPVDPSMLKIRQVDELCF
ncbi:MAG: dCMP deaminase family protein [Candidatus Aenigmarchaeota archaeon]|nr:dCMP deaminase family protein [Candidatus Aenigmarchaeota archaeon]